MSAAGINVQLGIKKETTWDTPAGASGAQLLQRTTMIIDLAKQVYRAANKVSTAQISDMRHGVRSVPGTLSGDLGPGLFNLPMQSVVRKDFAAGATTGAIAIVTAAAGPPGTFTRSSGSFITDGFKVGDVVRWSGWATTGVPNNGVNYRITALTATVMTTSGVLNEVVAAKAAGDTVTCVVVGKKTASPITGLTLDSYSIEKWFPDAATPLSELYTGVRFAGFDINLPATGMATFAAPLLGRNIVRGASQYFTSPTAASTNPLLAAVNGVLRLNGADIATVTGLNIKCANAAAGTPAAVGTNLLPGIVAGNGSITGQLTSTLDSPAIRDLFIDETEFALHVMLTTNNTATADFQSFYLGRVKLTSAGKDDPDLAIVQTCAFEALLNTAGGPAAAYDQSTIAIQDSTI